MIVSNCPDMFGWSIYLFDKARFYYLTMKHQEDTNTTSTPGLCTIANRYSVSCNYAKFTFSPVSYFHLLLAFFHCSDPHVSDTNRVAKSRCHAKFSGIYKGDQRSTVRILVIISRLLPCKVVLDQRHLFWDRWSIIFTKHFHNPTVGSKLISTCPVLTIACSG